MKMRSEHRRVRLPFPLMMLAFVLAGGLAVMLLWNNIVVRVIPGVRNLNYWQALGLLVLCRILFGGFRGGFGPGFRPGRPPFGPGGPPFRGGRGRGFGGPGGPGGPEGPGDFGWPGAPEGGPDFSGPGGPGGPFSHGGGPFQDDPQWRQKIREKLLTMTEEERERLRREWRTRWHRRH